MKTKLLLGSLCLFLIVGCSENPIESSGNDKQGFSLSAYYDEYYSDSALVVVIRFDGIPHTFPKISINNQVIDSGYYSDYFVHRIKQFSGNSFSYAIEFNGDRISDSIIIPDKISSVYCNGKLLKDTIRVTIDSSSTYTFSWNKVENAILYSKQIWSDISHELDVTSSDTVIILTPTRTQPEYSGAYGTLYLSGYFYPQITSKSKPNKESEKLFVYYDAITGPYREINFEIQ